MQSNRAFSARAAICVLTALGIGLIVALTGCGGDNNGSPSSSPTPPALTATPTAQPSSAPFANGEGTLLSSQLVVSYPTKAPAAAAQEMNAVSAGSIALDTAYAGIICAGLSSAQCVANEASLNVPLFGNFNVATDPIGNNPLGIKLVDALKIQYQAINVDQSLDPVSGGLLVPEVAATSIKGVIIYYHGTTVDRTNVPSNFVTATNSGGDTEGTLLAALWASQGYVVVMPDYIGLGNDTTHPHPYVVYPQTNAQSGLAMLDAVRSVLSNSYGISGALPLFLTGYSEGGAYSLEAGHLMQNNSGYAAVLQVSLKIAAPVSGAFDLSGTVVPYLFDNVTPTNNNWFSLDPTQSALSKPYLLGYLILGYAEYSATPPLNIVPSAFYNCSNQATCGNQPNLTGLYFSSGLPDDQVLLDIDSQALNTAWQIPSNDIAPLLTQAYATAFLNKDLTNALYALTVAADTYLFVPNFPLSIVSLMEDSVVTRKNSDVAFGYIEQQNPAGPYQELLINNSSFLAQGLFGAGPIDHLSELPFLGVLLLNQFNIAP